MAQVNYEYSRYDTIPDAINEGLVCWLADLVVEYPRDGEGDAGDPDDRDDSHGAPHLGLARDAQRVADGLQGRDSMHF